MIWWIAAYIVVALLLFGSYFHDVTSMKVPSKQRRQVLAVMFICAAVWPLTFVFAAGMKMREMAKGHMP